MEKGQAMTFFSIRSRRAIARFLSRPWVGPFALLALAAAGILLIEYLT